MTSGSATNPTADIGVIGLAVMGQNLALNLADHSYRVAVYNRTTTTMRELLPAMIVSGRQLHVDTS